MVQGRGTLVRLYGVLPAPREDVPLHEVLEFRHRRRDELLAMRHHLERMYRSVEDASDRESAIRTEMEALDVAVAEAIKVARESAFPWRRIDLSASLNLSGIIGSTVILTSQGMPLTAALLSSAAGSLAIGPSIGLARYQQSTNPFEYVVSAHRESII